MNVSILQESIDMVKNNLRNSEASHDRKRDPCLLQVGAWQVEHIAKLLHYYLLLAKFPLSVENSAFYSTNFQRTRETAKIFGEVLFGDHFDVDSTSIGVAPDNDDIFRPFESKCDLNKFIEWEKQVLGTKYYEEDSLTIKQKGLINSFMGDTHNWLHNFMEGKLVPLCNGSALPYGEEATQFGKVNQLFESKMKDIFTSKESLYYSKEVVPQSMQFVYNVISATVNGANTAKNLVLVATHDYFQAFFLASLGINNFSWPLFGSTVILETWKTPDNEYYIKIIQDGTLLKQLTFDEFDDISKFRSVNYECPYNSNTIY